MARDGRLDLLITPASAAADVPAFQWTELRRLSPVLIMPATHPLAKLKKIAPGRLRELPLIGLARENYPDYVRSIRTLLKPFGVTPRFVALMHDGISTLFPALEANHAAAILADGVESIMPRTLVTRPFSPALAETSVAVGVPAVRPNPHAVTFARVLQDEAARTLPPRK
jgi:DNA-binding transcriptional LysR family regulator